MSTGGLIYFNVVLPAIIVAIALAGVLLHKRSLRKSRHPEAATMTISDRIAELERTLAALIAGASGWPAGLTDAAVKRIEAQIEVLQMTDEDLRELSEQYQESGPDALGTTSAAIMAELARRSTLSAHDRNGGGRGAAEGQGMLTAHQRIQLRRAGLRVEDDLGSTFVAILDNPTIAEASQFPLVPRNKAFRRDDVDPISLPFIAFRVRRSEWMDMIPGQTRERSSGIANGPSSSFLPNRTTAASISSLSSTTAPRTHWRFSRRSSPALEQTSC